MHKSLNIEKQNKIIKIENKGQNIRNKVYRIVVANQTNIWNHIVLAVIKHVEHQIYVRKQHTNASQQKIKAQIEDILRWVSDPNNKSMLLWYKKQEQIWTQQKQEWESTFEKVLQNRLQQKEKHENELIQLKEMNKRLGQENAKLLGRNSVLQSALQLSLSKYSTKVERPAATAKIGSGLQIGHVGGDGIKKGQKMDRLKIISYGCLAEISLGGQGNMVVNKEDAATMTNEILWIGEQAQQITDRQPNQQVRVWDQYVQTSDQYERDGNKQYSICKTQDAHICGSINTVNTVNTVSSLNRSSSRNSSSQTCQQQYVNMGCQTQGWGAGVQVAQYHRQVQKRDTNITQTNISNTDYDDDTRQYEISAQSQPQPQLLLQKLQQQQQKQQQQQSSSQSQSQSEYIIQYDRQTQTEIVEYAEAHVQSEQYNSNRWGQSAMGSLLLKIAHLQHEIQDKNTRMQQADERNKQLMKQVQMGNRKIGQLQNQLNIAMQIQQHCNSQYSTLKQEYGQLHQNYTHMLSSVSTYMHILNTQHLSHQSTQTQLTNTHFLTHTHQPYYYTSATTTTQTTTAQTYCYRCSDIQSNVNIEQRIQNSVDKSTILRYLLQYIQLQVQGAHPDRKAQTLLTAISALAPTQAHSHLIHQFIHKINTNPKYLPPPPTPKLQQQLYKYLTQ